MSEGTTRVRTRPIEGGSNAGGPTPGDPRRAELRERARRMLAIIDEALSDDSANYLERSRQRGGQ